MASFANQIAEAWEKASASERVTILLRMRRAGRWIEFGQPDGPLLTVFKLRDGSAITVYEDSRDTRLTAYESSRDAYFAEIFEKW